ncbi:MAG: hypothetical protein HC918_13870, partial [Oscillatoriales cyanobacterium SM2_1_8]|nr:hypothetical protein [Oscillatoriales cyanobacterium SM2_1_8]
MEEEAARQRAAVPSTPDRSPDRWAQQVREQLLGAARLARTGGNRATHDPFIDELGNGGEDNISLNLQEGIEYLIVGVCDEDCSDLDLVLRDDNGNIVSSDTKDDDIPIVRITPRWNARFKVQVTMASCTNAPCRYGIGVLAIVDGLGRWTIPRKSHVNAIDTSSSSRYPENVNPLEQAPMSHNLYEPYQPSVNTALHEKHRLTRHLAVGALAMMAVAAPLPAPARPTTPSLVPSPELLASRPDPWAQQVREQLLGAARLARTGGNRATHNPFIDELGNGGKDNISLNLQKDIEYLIVGVCDAGLLRSGFGSFLTTRQ